MARVFLGLGSNIDAENNLQGGLQRLASDYFLVKESPWYKSPALGFDGPDFINLVVEIVVEDGLSVAELSEQLKKIEADFGRAANAVKYSSRHLDIDILMFDDLVADFERMALPRADIWQYAFVLKPLLDIFPDGLCPKNNKPLADYWPEVADQPLQEMLYSSS